MLGRMERSEELRHLLQAAQLIRFGHVPDRLGLEARLRQVQLDGLQRGLGAHGLLLVRDDTLRHRDAPEAELEAAATLGAERLLDGSVRVLLRLGVVVALVRRDERGAGAEVELSYQVALAEV